MFTRSFRISPLTSVLLTATLGLGAIGSAQAATFFVRTDGGDANQCNGRADTAYTGSGTAQNCAWKHPYYALPSSGTARIAGGDTLMIGSGEYMIGYGAPGATCTTGDRTSCWIGKIPSGPSSTAKTRILGNGATAPKLWGTQGNAIMLNLEGSSNVEIGNLEITDKDQCVVRHANSSAACQTGGNWAQYGIYAYNSGNVWIHDVNVHGMGHTGFGVSYLNNWTVERTKINNNGWAGWNGDSSTSKPNTGQMILRDVEVAWNGCGQNPSTGAAVNCWAQQSGGYGDGIGLNASAGQWLIEDAFVHHNTSDGLDFLYLDGAPSTSIIFRRVYAVANAGNQIKSLGNTIIENSVVIGSCGYFKGQLLDGELCRASGNSLSLTPAANTVITVRHNTITGEGDNLILTREGDSTGKVYLQNNALIGNTDYVAAASGWPEEKTAGHYAYNSPAAVSFSGNLFWNVKSSQCPSGSICQDPKVKSAALASFDGTPQTGSPVIDKAPLLSGVTTDFLLQARPVGGAADIGAYEVQTGGTTPPPTPTCTRAAPAVSLSGPTASVAAGTTVSYTLSLTNKDTGDCAATSFSLARTVPVGWTGTLSATSLNLAPGASANATLSVTSANGTAAGGYGIGTGVSSAIGGAHTGNASATYTVKSVTSEPTPPTAGLTESVGTDKTSYVGGQTVYMSARVLSNGQPVSGAAVKFTTYKPNGVKIVKSGTTGADGYARRSFISGTSRGNIGSYQLTAVATIDSRSATASSNFSVTKY